MHVKRGSKIYKQSYKKGKVDGPVKELTVAEKKEIAPELATITSGTSTTFLLDPDIFKEGIEIDFEVLKKSIKERAYLIPKIFFHLRRGRKNG